MYQLKKGQESFTPVEGPFAKKMFSPGIPYAEIPPQEAKRFTEIKEAAPEASPAAGTEKPAKADSKKAGAVSSSEKGGGKS